ncbi:hormogonium polysaccharide biosynthesis protein HpsA [Okeania sp.]|uniref:hormogonium polysaccharide biosynthesis protein HpsA n=1 Tax=Okeania sp. TaxID=3100323 RepID=UPI002B4AED77|nr:hormogonium polysaccharide biosynthesis protein HpsA [Okeania sp.]MEB3342537.1 hormogonium polysaccharide biosynthesis protein HpsA [Okeania sp.]
MYYHSILKNINNIVRTIGKQLRLLKKALVRAIALSRKNIANASIAGLVLPTATMVMIVVLLLTTAILLRSFDRAEQARNVRVSQQALSAATPALDRARAKIQYLLREDPILPRETPSDDVLNSTLASNRYEFGDEEKLEVSYDLDEDNTIEDDEKITTAWRFPVDTDNDETNDSYTIYGIFFRTPRNGTEFKRKRRPLEARTPPMSPLGVLQNQGCEGALGSSASLVGDSGWYKLDGKLTKSFFVYIITVPMNGKAVNPGITALEYQEDWKRLPLTNNAVVYEDDLEISPGPAFRINGRMLTNSNLVVSPYNNVLRSYQVSSDESCFYQAENSKIIVGGNVVNGMSSSSKRNNVAVDLFQGNGSDVKTDQVISTTNQSVNNETAYDTIYNNNAYEKRISVMVEDQMKKQETTDPEEAVIEKVNQRMEDEGTDDAERRTEIRREELGTYFRDRTRKVPFGEVSAKVDYNPTETPEGSGDTLRPPDKWILPTDTETKITLDVNQLQARVPNDEEDRPEQFLGERILVGNNLPATWWNGSEFVSSEQTTGGKWVDDSGNLIDAPVRTRIPRVTELPAVGSTARNGFWERKAGQVPEASLDGIGGLRIVTGAGIYSRTDSFLPPPRIDDPGTTTVDESLYDDPATTTVTEQYTVVWPDTMPMSPGANGLVYDNANLVGGGWQDISAFISPNAPPTKGDLQMRATVLYHYAQDPINPNGDPVDNDQKPIACISSYYDPTSSITAANFAPTGTELPDVGFGATANGKSNNGVVYPPPKTARPTTATFTAATGLFSNTTPTALAEQANMVFPDGRFANRPLRKALKRLSDNGDLTLEEQAAIDSTLCSLDILAGGTFAPTTTPSTGVTINHGVIKEVTLLDARQVKAMDADDPTTTVDETFTLASTLAAPANLTSKYDLFLEERQPLEIRLTQLDLNQMREQEIPFNASITTGPSPEYLLPNSGIIYVSRDDALPDRSDRTPNSDNNAIDEDISAALSATDYKLDPTRRPNGIMLINGQRLARNDQNDDGQNDTAVSKVEDIVKEKGLTLVSNLPVYIHGEFNLHTQQEFTQDLTTNWSNFYTRTAAQINQNFACRKGDPRISGCTTGDSWRPANVLADAITLLSDNPNDLDSGFRTGFRNEGDFDLRNNAGNFKVVFNSTQTGYDFNTNDTSDASLGLDETVAATDLNGDGDQTDIDEGVLGFDLDGDGVITNAALPEANITVAGARMLNGFYGNNFVTNGLSSGSYFTATGTPPTVNEVTYDAGGNPTDGATPTPNSVTPMTDSYYSTNTGDAVNSSYFNNYVTPVQRRGEFPEYVMEMCRKLPVSSCQPVDWFVGLSDGTGKEIASQVVNQSVNKLIAGTTARPALNPDDRRYPRRIAFQRNTNNLVLDANGVAIPLGIDSSKKVALYTYPSVPPTTSNALWFRTSSNITDPTADADYGNTYPLFYWRALVETSANVGTVQQPLLVPVLQNYLPTTTPEATQPTFLNLSNKTLNSTSKWLTRASGSTTFNLVVGSGDVPPRPPEANGGLQNLPRFLENWATGNSNNSDTNITGSFIQLNRSAYATAPFPQLPPNGINGQQGANSRFGYRGSYKLNNYTVNNAGARIGYFLPPDRNWGYDVGLLSQAPDYFAQQQSGEDSSGEPDRYYREVSLDDDWVKALLSSKVVPK